MLDTRVIIDIILSLHVWMIKQNTLNKMLTLKSVTTMLIFRSYIYQFINNFVNYHKSTDILTILFFHSCNYEIMVLKGNYQYKKNYLKSKYFFLILEWHIVYQLLKSFKMTLWNQIIMKINQWKKSLISCVNYRPSVTVQTHFTKYVYITYTRKLYPV